MASNGHRVVHNDDYLSIIDTVMEAQALLMNAQEKLGRLRYEEHWDGLTERRRETKIRNGAYHRQDGARA